MQGQGKDLRPSSQPADAGGASLAVDVLDRLVEVYGEPIWREPTDPLDELIGTILSQNTSDVNSGRAFAHLRQAFPSWDLAASASEKDIASAIRVGGLADVKTRHIKACLANLTAQHGRPSLDFLRDLDTETARQTLIAIPGVGPKTAACVLLFSLGRGVLPVDTHVHRVSLRIGLAPPRSSPEQVERILESQLPPDTHYAAHVNLITHGRRVCLAQRPKCSICPLFDLCARNL